MNVRLLAVELPSLYHPAIRNRAGEVPMTENPDLTRIRSLFESDGVDIRDQFIFAGLLLTIFERFKRYVVDRVDGFFADHVEIKDGDLRYKRGEKFKRLIKDKGSHKAGQHSNAAFRAALHWFYDFEAITKQELDDVERLYILRNEIGHELLEILADSRKNPIALVDVLITFAVYVKIVRWWVKEVEATTDPDFDQERYDSTKWDEVESFDTIFLRQIMHKALAGNAQWEAIKQQLDHEITDAGSSDLSTA